MQSDWTEEKLRAFRVHYDNELTYKQIGALIGFSRNACIAKARQLGWAVRNCDMTRGSRPRVQGAPRLVVMPAPIEEAAPLPPLVESAPVRPIDLESWHCKFPLGDPSTPDFRHCGAPKPMGQSYCPTHAKIAYSPGSSQAQARKAKEAMERSGIMRTFGGGR